MIDNLGYGLLQSGIYNDIGESYAMMPMFGGIGCGYGNRDALTLRGPLAYDQYGDPAVKEPKDNGFWKGIFGGALAVGGCVLLAKCPAITKLIAKFKK